MLTNTVFNPTTDQVMRSCLTKHRYKSRHQAMNMAAKVMSRRGTNLRAYSCPFCFGWHLTRRGA